MYGSEDTEGIYAGITVLGRPFFRVAQVGGIRFIQQV